MGTSSVMPSASNPIPYKLRKRTQISYLEIESDNDDLNNSPNEIEITGPPAKRPKRQGKKRPKNKIFPFMDLPIELRDQIYQETLTDSNGIYLVSKTRSYRRQVSRAAYQERPDGFSVGRGYPGPLNLQSTTEDDPQSKSDDLPPLITPLLAVSKTVKAEAEQWLYSRNEFILEDTMALHAFVTDLTAFQRGLLRRITVKGWGYTKAHKAMNYPAFSILAQGGTNLSSLRLDCLIGWVCNKEGLIAQRVYREAFHWLEAMERTRGIDETVKVLHIDKRNWDGMGSRTKFNYQTHRYETEHQDLPLEKILHRFNEELKRLITAETIRPRDKKERNERQKSKKMSEDDRAWA